MLLKKILLVTSLSMTSLLSPALMADQLNMQSVGVAPSAVDRPRHGSTMNAVLQRYGEPSQRMTAVGQPPITRWQYPDFTVYFEYRHVIHSVVHR